MLKSGLDVKITMIEKLPVPYGLVRYGVAPDHPEVKNVIHEFEEIASNRDRFSFFGNVSIGNEIGMHELSVPKPRFIFRIFLMQWYCVMDQERIKSSEFQGSHSPV